MNYKCCQHEEQAPTFCPHYLFCSRSVASSKRNLQRNLICGPLQ
ncbi:unnamed protein product, partial [Allacma fusca]